MLAPQCMGAAVLGLLLQALMRDRGAASVRSCVLLDKVSRRAVPIQPQYVGMVCVYARV